MTDREAFVIGVGAFCKSAGLDAEDAHKMSALLLTDKAAATPIVKAASLEVERVRYFRAGATLAKRANYEAAMAALQGMNLQPGDWSRLATEAQKQQQATSTTGASNAGTTSSAVAPAAAPAADTASQGGGESAGGGEGDGFSWGKELGDTASYAVTGATIGSAVPVIGTGIGALIGGGIGLGKGLWNYFTQGDKKTTAKPTDDPAQVSYDKYKAAYEKSPYKGQMSLQQYAALKGQYDNAKAQTGEIVPEDAFIGGQWAATKNRIATNMSRRTLRGMGYSMAPGELAGLSDSDIAARSNDPGEQAALRQARNLAAQRQKRQGGSVSSRMGMGFSTGSGAPTSTAPVAQTSSGAASAPPDSMAATRERHGWKAPKEVGDVA